MLAEVQRIVSALRESFNVELPQAVVWERLRLPAPATAGHFRIPGFPSADGQPGCIAVPLAHDPQRALRVRKQDAPCADSVIAIEIGPANASGWPTRVTVAQSDLPPPMAAMPDMVAAHWRQIVADFRLYVERGVVAPPAAWGASLGAIVQQTPIGLALGALEEGGFAERCRMAPGDLLLTLRGVRILDIGQLWAVLALSPPADAATVTWVRDGQPLAAAAPFASLD